MIWCASSVESCLAVSAPGTVNVTPDFIRFMLSSMKADGLLRYSETSIWSSDTPLGLLLTASDVSVSPGLTLMPPSLAPLDTGGGDCFSTAGLGAGVGLGAGDGLGARADGVGAGTGAGSGTGAGIG